MHSLLSENKPGMVQITLNFVNITQMSMSSSPFRRRTRISTEMSAEFITRWI